MKRGTARQCGRCRKNAKTTALTMSTLHNTSVVFLCESCLVISRDVFNRLFVNGETPRWPPPTETSPLQSSEQHQT